MDSHGAFLAFIAFLCRRQVFAADSGQVPRLAHCIAPAQVSGMWIGVCQGGLPDTVLAVNSYS